MAVKVVAKRLVEGDVDAVARLRDDTVPRVQAAASRALERLSHEVRERPLAQPRTPT